jgi:hypothetical protein
VHCNNQEAANSLKQCWNLFFLGAWNFVGQGGLIRTDQNFFFCLPVRGFRERKTGVDLPRHWPVSAAELKGIFTKTTASFSR